MTTLGEKLYIFNSIYLVEIVQIALIYYILENHNMCIMEEILIAIKVMDNLISLCQCQSVITFLTFFFFTSCTRCFVSMQRNTLTLV